VTSLVALQTHKQALTPASLRHEINVFGGVSEDGSVFTHVDELPAVTRERHKRSSEGILLAHCGLEALSRQVKKIALHGSPKRKIDGTDANIIVHTKVEQGYEMVHWHGLIMAHGLS